VAASQVMPAPLIVGTVPASGKINSP